MPVSEKKVFTTVSDNQSSVEIHVMQGDSSKASENISLGQFLLSGIREGEKGEPRISVEFYIDVDGIAHVSAEDVDTGAIQKISIKPVDENKDSEQSPVILKAKVSSLKNRVESLYEGYEGSLENEFKREIKDIIKEAKKAEKNMNAKTLRECQIALETIVGELNSMHQETEAGLGGA